MVRHLLFHALLGGSCVPHCWDCCRAAEGRSSFDQYYKHSEEIRYKIFEGGAARSCAKSGGAANDPDVFSGY